MRRLGGRDVDHHHPGQRVPLPEAGQVGHQPLGRPGLRHAGGRLVPRPHLRVRRPQLAADLLDQPVRQHAAVGEQLRPLLQRRADHVVPAEDQVPVRRQPGPGEVRPARSRSRPARPARRRARPPRRPPWWPPSRARRPARRRSGRSPATSQRPDRAPIGEPGRRPGRRWGWAGSTAHGDSSSSDGAVCPSESGAGASVLSYGLGVSGRRAGAPWRAGRAARSACRGRPRPRRRSRRRPSSSPAQPSPAPSVGVARSRTRDAASASATSGSARKASARSLSSR